MTARRRAGKKQAIRDADRRLIPAWVWLTLGIVMGLGLAAFLLWSGVMRPGSEQPRPVPAASSEGPADISAGAEEEWRPKYDFYTVLPEMEVVIPEEELADRVNRRQTEADSAGPFVIQVGSFREYADADRIKAELALLGIIAHVREVSIDERTWHRVRVGPFDSIRETDRVKRQLQSNNYDALVLSEKG
ncbi:MAG: SPOR domain-containing protein [Xanthomonadales bacterium]|nr:SPOR domain-containing protein [Xanthomonadales bacterium]